MNIHYLETGSTDPAWNLAFEEMVLKLRRSAPYLILWQNDNTIVVGQNQNTEEEINRSFVEAHGIHVVRRMTGGGAVYHDLGNLNYSFIDDSGPAEELSFERFTGAVVDALKGLDLTAEASGRNDILVNGCKVSGTAQRVADGRILYHGTLLFDSKPEMIAGALNVDPLKFKSKSKKSVRARVGNIRSFLNKDMDIEEFKAYLIDAFGRSGLVRDSLTSDELKEVEALKHDKYDSWNWTYGRSPKFSLTSKQKWPGGIIDIRADVAEGIIREIKFYGDFLSLKPLDELEQALIGIRFVRQDMQECINEYLLKSHGAFREYFGSVTEDEVLETIFSSGNWVCKL